MLVLFMGAPGAGKGTQADLVCSRMGIKKLSTGDALRAQVKKGSELGKRVGLLMANGELVPDDLLTEILQCELKGTEDALVILDGYPRNVAQAELLEKMGKIGAVGLALHLDVAREKLVSRIAGRRTCSECQASYHVDLNPPKSAAICDKCGSRLLQREDDEYSRVQRRLEIYDGATKPVLEYYQSKGLYVMVDGDGSSESVYERVSMLVRKARSEYKLA